MGIVFKAHDTTLRRTVAVKVLSPELAVRATACKRFQREAFAAAAVTHPHVVTIHAVEPGKIPYLVMEFVDGQTLSGKIERKGMLEPAEILRIGSQAAQGLAAAHKLGLIHRDIKPANILLENGVERVKITDFGLARAGDDLGVTRTGEIAGTPQYMSPEQAMGKRVDHRSDLFSLGSVLYAMCTGRSPFRADSPLSAIRRVCDDIPRPIRSVNPEIPQSLADVVAKLLAKDPDQRIQTAQEVADAFDRQLAALQHSSTASRHGMAAMASPQKPTEQKPIDTVRPFTWWLIAGGACALFLVVGLAVWMGLTQILRHNGLFAFNSKQTTVGEIVRFENHAATIEVAVPTPNGKWVLSGDDDGILILWDIRTGREVRRLPVPERAVWDIAPFSDGRRILTSQMDGVARLWDIETGEMIRAYSANQSPLRCVSLAPGEETFLTAGSDDLVRRWNVESGELLGEWPGHTSTIRGLAHAPDGRRAVSGSRDGTLRIWDVESGESIVSIRHAQWYVNDVDFSPDGRTVVSVAHDKTARIWNAKTGEELQWLSGHTDIVRRVAFSPNGASILTAGDDGTIRLWETKTGRELHTFWGHAKRVYSVAFSSDEAYAVSAGMDTTVRVWQLPEWSKQLQQAGRD